MCPTLSAIVPDPRSRPTPRRSLLLVADAGGVAVGWTGENVRGDNERSPPHTASSIALLRLFLLALPGIPCRVYAPIDDTNPDRSWQMACQNRKRGQTDGGTSTPAALFLFAVGMVGFPARLDRT